MEKDALIQLEEAIARLKYRHIEYSAMLTPTSADMPEINPDHTQLIKAQKRLGKRGFIVVAELFNQSFVPALTLRNSLEEVFVTSTRPFQARGDVSPIGRRCSTIILCGEEEKSEWEPLRVWGKLTEDRIELARKPLISSQCFRVPVEFGHMAAVFVRFRQPIESTDILMRWRDFSSVAGEANLPSAPRPFLRYFEETDRPQPKYDVSSRKGWVFPLVAYARTIFDYKFVCLSHNLVRSAARGSILTAELLVHQDGSQTK